MSDRKTDAIARQLDSFSGLLEEISEKLAPFGDYANPQGFLQLQEDFHGQTQDFFSEQRKFNLAVLGQVKAGKSSFLNMLLFDGEPVLPRAATPKTSALTRIEYAPKNQLTVEYITPAEWVSLRRLAASPLETPQVRAAKETIALADSLGTPIERCLAKGRETINFDNYADLNCQLEAYVGESGILTPMVKYVTLGLELECLKNLSVIDTPGLNDPLSSRTQRTRQFLSRCDAAFFLSRSSYFLDRNDLLLLTSQLPQKGVGRLVLVASQYDSALMDTAAEYESLEQADLETRLLLRRHAAQSVDEAVRTMRRCNDPQNIIQVIEQCRSPIFVSVVAQNMCKKNPTDYAAVEKIVQSQLSLQAPVTAEVLAEIGGFDEVHAIFDSLVAEKEELLQRKAVAFVVTAQSNLRTWLSALQDAQRVRKKELEISRLRLEQRQLELSQRVNRLRGALSAAIEQYFQPLDGAMTHVAFALNNLQTVWSNPPTRMELEVSTHTKTVSATKWNRPSTWGKHYRVYFSEETARQVIDPEEVRSYLAQFWAAASDLCADAFLVLEDTPLLTNALYCLIDEQFAADSAVRQPQWLSQLVSHALAMLILQPSAPVLNPDSLLPIRFSRPMRNPTEQRELCEAAQTSVALLTEDLRHYLTHSEAALRGAGCSALEFLQAELGSEMMQEQTMLFRELSDVCCELANRQELAELLGWYL